MVEEVKNKGQLVRGIKSGIFGDCVEDEREEGLRILLAWVMFN